MCASSSLTSLRPVLPFYFKLTSSRLWQLRPNAGVAAHTKTDELIGVAAMASAATSEEPAYVLWQVGPHAPAASLGGKKPGTQNCTAARSCECAPFHHITCESCLSLCEKYLRAAKRRGSAKLTLRGEGSWALDQLYPPDQTEIR